MTIKKRKFEFTGNKITSLFYVPIFLVFHLIGMCIARHEDQTDPIQMEP